MIDEFKAMQKAAQGGDNKGGKTGNNNTTKNGIEIKSLDGQAYIVDTTHLQKIQLEAKQIKFAGIANSTDISTINYFEYQGFIATDDKLKLDGCKPRASINWDIHTISAIPGYEIILATIAVVLSNPYSSTQIISTTEKLFYMNSGATVHILPCASDFITLKAIPP